MAVSQAAVDRWGGKVPESFVEDSPAGTAEKGKLRELVQRRGPRLEFAVAGDRLLAGIAVGDGRLLVQLMVQAIQRQFEAVGDT